MSRKDDYFCAEYVFFASNDISGRENWTIISQ